MDALVIKDNSLSIMFLYRLHLTRPCVSLQSTLSHHRVIIYVSFPNAFGFVHCVPMPAIRQKLNMNLSRWKSKTIISFTCILKYIIEKNHTFSVKLNNC